MAAWANVEGQTLPERKRSQAKTMPIEVVNTTIIPTPNQG